ncbi:hypothetical protein ORV05_35825 [Amycolatopsis cynarae]|uniref:Uncharacterized protein n=1 Tax=Amycolatopsis cynarae TaxID=2995223 RepID=A0ABY7B1I8_9PSEU|nr:hypothetical protein [Amycolatopsis sp. HUAS 11-8]WAL66150.1 hypothetical protein ORV05_35825 [Amycolatopsis sp. HUAS 11-8]
MGGLLHDDGWVLHISGRLTRRIRADFGADADLVLEILADLDLPPSDTRNSRAVERILSAVVLMARGDLNRFDQAARLAWRDWRDVLVDGGLAYDDWPTRLDVELGPEEN